MIFLSLIFAIGTFASQSSPEEKTVQASIGRGLAAVSEKEGFRLSPEAERNFGIVRKALVGRAPWQIPSNAVLASLDETSVYRFKAGFYKRIPVTIVTRKGPLAVIRSPDLSPNDEIASEGVGFLRITEVSANGGLPDEH